MLITRLYLRNFRVYEDELDLELPPGVVGIYGPNGAGKSTLLEAIVFTLWGKARTAKEDIRSTGVGHDCVTELEFEHEGHLYGVRRRLSGANYTPRSEATCDGLLMSEGVRDTARYLHSILGMDDVAFRASVFAEQKQLAAFSSQTPSERRRLVLQLLGITPLDAARDAARRDSRDVSQRHQELRRMLPDLHTLEVAAADAEARAAASEARATDDERAAEAAGGRAEQAAVSWRRLDSLRQEHEALVIEGKSARSSLDAAAADVKSLSQELEELEVADAELAAATTAASGLDAAEEKLRLLSSAAAAEEEEAKWAARVGPEPQPPDRETKELLAAAAEKARSDLAAAEGAARTITAELARARDNLKRTGSISSEADCPLCGQALGDAFEKVQAHRASEVSDAEARLAACDQERLGLSRTAQDAATALQECTAGFSAAEAAVTEWKRSRDRHAEAHAVLAGVLSALGDGAPAVGNLASALETTTDEVRQKRAASALADRLRGRLERRPAVDSSLADARRRVDEAGDLVTALRDKVKALNFDPAALAKAAEQQSQAVTSATAAGRVAQASQVEAAKERAGADAAAQRLGDGRAQHAQLIELESDSRHLSRLADLLSDFRNTVVATVGPRLAVQAAELFGELTDNEYDELQVDPETYGLQISDGGRVFGLERFSGSEVDLANLALRVAISEQIRFQSGGAVGLLVLDEVFGPLDDERKSRMLLALERLRGRFRQILVVTHDASIKEQLPNAVEVVKQPGRRATARLL